MILYNCMIDDCPRIIVGDDCDHIGILYMGLL